jgi:hypothetical protein
MANIILLINDCSRSPQDADGLNHLDHPFVPENTISADVKPVTFASSFPHSAKVEVIITALLLKPKCSSRIILPPGNSQDIKD